MLFSRILLGGHGPATFVWQMTPADKVGATAWQRTPRPSCGAASPEAPYVLGTQRTTTAEGLSVPGLAFVCYTADKLRCCCCCCILAAQITSKAIPLVIMVAAATGVGYGGYNLIMKEPGN